MKKKITKKMKFSEFLKDYPKAEDILMEKGMFCFGCPMAMQETLEQGALAHGLKPEEFIKEIKGKLKD